MNQLRDVSAEEWRGSLLHLLSASSNVVGGRMIGLPSASARVRCMFEFFVERILMPLVLRFNFCD